MFLHDGRDLGEGPVAQPLGDQSEITPQRASDFPLGAGDRHPAAAREECSRGVQRLELDLEQSRAETHIRPHPKALPAAHLLQEAVLRIGRGRNGEDRRQPAAGLQITDEVFRQGGRRRHDGRRLHCR